MQMKLVKKVHSKMNLNALTTVLLSPSKYVQLGSYLSDLSQYLSFRKDVNNESDFSFQLYPCLGDHAESQSGYDDYFYQDTWAARQVFETKPESLIDIGSTVLLVGILSQYCPVTSLDIRPIISQLPDLSAKRGDILSLPFEDSTVEYIQSMCVLEHIGLGRYGDSIDPLGTEKAIKQVKRVIRPMGHFAFSVPVGLPCISFNAHRIFSREQIFSWFDGWRLVDELQIDRRTGLTLSSDLKRPGNHTVGCFHFQKLT